MSEIQKAKSRTIYVDFDFDTNEPSAFDFSDVVNCEACTILDTRGGFHLLIEPDKVHDKYKKSWYQNISKRSGCDVRGDNMIPIVGCSQGNYIPYFLK